MKNIIKLIILFFTLIFNSTSYAEWTQVGGNINGDNIYVDFDNLKKFDGYIYWWEMQDLLKPDKDGDISYKHYRQGDCKQSRIKILRVFYYTEPMGKGTVTTLNISKKWFYPRPNSTNANTLKLVCSK